MNLLVWPLGWMPVDYRAGASVVDTQTSDLYGFLKISEQIKGQDNGEQGKTD